MLHPADPNLRNVAIIAHVDHGKTTLVDALLGFCGSPARGTEATDCVLDSDPLERERGITIFSKTVANPLSPSTCDPRSYTHTSEGWRNGGMGGIR